MSTIEQSTIDYMHNALDLGGEDFEFRAYSGRFMYGSECLALVTDAGPWTIVAALTELYAIDPGEQVIFELITNEPEQDSMGMSTVYYWPGITIEDDSE